MGKVPTMSMNDFNSAIIAEFRDNGGKVGGNFEGAPLLLLHTTGAKSGESRVNPMMYQAVDGGWAVFALYAGLDENTAWFQHLKTRSDVAMARCAEGEAEGSNVHAKVVTPGEREPVWQEQKRRYPGFAEYEQK